jgi:ribose 5-phosphate isomerase RpiB
VLCLGARVLGPVVAVEAVAAWLNAIPGDGRHVTRIAKLDELDEHLVDDER